jgi:hypothetical protein
MHVLGMFLRQNSAKLQITTHKGPIVSFTFYKIGIKILTFRKLSIVTDITLFCGAGD